MFFDVALYSVSCAVMVQGTNYAINRYPEWEFPWRCIGTTFAFMFAIYLWEFVR